jgi:hypothetical protein
LVDAISASQILRLAPILIEQMAEDQQIPHYQIAGHIRFDPHDLHVWVASICHVRRAKVTDVET